MQNLTNEQLTDLLEKAHRVIEASIKRNWVEYDSAYLAYDAARDVIRDAQRKEQPHA